MNDTKIKYNSEKLDNIALSYNLSLSEVEKIKRSNNFILAKDKKTNELEFIPFESLNYIKKHLRHLYLVKEILFVKANNEIKDILIEEKEDISQGIYQVNIVFFDNQMKH